jgi:hypothetical protein
VTVSLTGRLKPVANPRRNRRVEPDPTAPRPADRRALNGILQHLIQPARPAATATHGLRITARCAGAQPGLDIGGDWYLSCVLPDGDLVFAVGDVAGHGLAASPAMLHLRTAMTAFAVEGHPPAVVLSRLNRLLHAPGSSHTATAVLARYHPAQARLTWARAGHPPLLFAEARTGRVRPLPNPHGPLLGGFPSARYEEASMRLLPGEAVLAYTDGLLARGQHFDRAVATLCGSLSSGLAGERPLDCFDYHAAGDDACALLAQRLP